MSKECLKVRFRRENRERLLLQCQNSSSKSRNKNDGELSQHMNTRVPSEPRYELRKRNHSQQQQNNILLLIHKFEKLAIYEMNEEDLSKTLKESVDSKGIIFPSFLFIY